MSGRLARSTVLVVDDNTSLVENLAEILEDAGFTVRTAGTCQEGLRAAKEGFALALVDLQLPDGKGTWLAEQLKAQNPDGEIVLLTGFASVESAQAAIKTGAFAYLVKPCAVPELLLTVGQAMRQVQLRADKTESDRRAKTAEKLAAVGTLMAGLSHEIRNPLNSAGLQLAVLERRVGKLPAELQPALLEPLLLVRDEIRRLNHVLEDFLQFARPREFAPSPIDLADLVKQFSIFLVADAEKRGITLETHCEPVPSIGGDDGRLRQVLMNLVLNAFEAAGAGEQVRLSVQPDKDEVVVTIDDSGPGVPPELRDRLFEPFFTTKPSGSGLGLPIVHAIVTQHGGTMRVETSPLGGARFELRFPRAP